MLRNRRCDKGEDDAHVGRPLSDRIGGFIEWNSSTCKNIELIETNDNDEKQGTQHRGEVA